jgi:predicted nucleic acid-binding protein
VLVPYLLPDHPDHGKVRFLINRKHAVNPTVIHETYHTCVFKLKREPVETVRALRAYMKLVLFLSITDRITEQALKLALEHRLGGRDALILASYLYSEKVSTVITLDRGLLKLDMIKKSGRNFLRIARHS